MSELVGSRALADGDVSLSPGDAKRSDDDDSKRSDDDSSTSSTRADALLAAFLKRSDDDETETKTDDALGTMRTGNSLSSYSLNSSIESLLGVGHATNTLDPVHELDEDSLTSSSDLDEDAADLLREALKFARAGASTDSGS